MDLISVIIPVYNAEKYLKKCIDSVLNQTYENFEILLVDDGSTDDSARICDEYALKYDFISVLHQTNHGQAYARNRALERMNGEYFVFIDSDDFIHPDYLRLTYEALKQTDSELAICDYVSVTEGEEVVIKDEKIDKIKTYDNYTIFTTDEFFSDVCDEKKIINCNKLYKKTLFDDIRYPEGNVHEDTATYYKYLYKSKKTVYIDNVLYFYTVNPLSTMRKKFSEKRLSEIFYLFEQAEFFEKLALEDKRYEPFIGETYKNAMLVFYWRNKDNADFDFKHNEKAKYIKKRLKPVVKKELPFGCANIDFYEFYFGKYNPLIRIRYFFYKMKRRFRIKILKKDG